MRGIHAFIGLLVIAAGLAAFSALYTVHQAEQALVLQFGEPKQLVQEPGLHVKLPFIQDVRRFDRRVLDFDAATEEMPTQDQKQLVVNAFARYRIVDPLLFYQTANNIRGMEGRLADIISNSLRDVFGGVSLATLLTPERANLMKVIAERVNAQGRPFGINIIDVRIKRVDLPEENSQAIFKRMQTQREQEARRIRAEGERDAKRIRAEGDKTRTVIEANARKRSEILRGEGDAEAQRIYTEAYGRDQRFFDFWVSMEALRQGLGTNTRYVGPPQGDFFKYFGDMTGEGGAQ